MPRKHMFRTAAVLTAMVTISVTGCTKGANEGSEGSDAGAIGTEASQVIEQTSEETCTNPSPSDKELSEMKIGFSQSENEQNPFRAIETESVREAVEKNAKEIIYTNANSDQAKQLSDIQSMINQGVDALIVAPIGSTGLQSAFQAAQDKGIPVVTIDRQTEGTPCEDYLSFLGSDFYEQGVRAGEALVEALGGEGRVAEIQGAPGSDVATLRTEGFMSVMEKNPGMEVVAQQTGNWATSEAQQVTEQLLTSNSDINGVYTHSDTMALGALTAIQNTGRQAGENVQVVSIDGTAEAVSRVASGEVAAVVETNPRFGPAAIQMLDDWFTGAEVPQEVIMKDSLYTEDNAQEAVDSGQAY